jgi:hypothetical protein
MFQTFVAFVARVIALAGVVVPSFLFLLIATVMPAGHTVLVCTFTAASVLWAVVGMFGFSYLMASVTAYEFRLG